MQQAIRTAQNPIQASLVIPGAKSITYRALLLAALADGVSEITGLKLDEDVRTFIKALTQLGVVIQLDESIPACIIAGCNGRFPKKQASIWCAESNIILRFLLAACAATPGVYHFDGTTRLREKPISELLNILVLQDAQLTPTDVKKLPLSLVGADSLAGGEFIFDQSLDNQVISALLLIAPFGRTLFNLTVQPIQHPTYVEMTCMMMAEFGVLVHRIHQGQFMVPVPQRYQARDYLIEPDFAQAAYFFASAAMTGGEVSIQPTKIHTSKQPAAKCLSTLKKMGCHIIESHKGLKVKGTSVLQGIEVNAKEVSDNFLVAAALAPFAVSPTRLLYRGTLNHTSQHRLAALKAEFTKLKIRFESGKDWLQIYPSVPQGQVLSAHHDAKIAMMLALIGLKVQGIQITDVETVTHMFPDFFTRWESLSTHLHINA